MRSVKDIMRSSTILDSNGVHIGGSDRESNHHYGDTYESLFGGYADINKRTYITKREDVKLMMEVGVADGSSLLAWREIFPNALCVGMDIHHAAKVCFEYKDRIEFHLGDQRLQCDCESAAGGRQFDLIVDDATHLLEDTLRTLYWLWPSVRPGGLYVVEEWPNIDREAIRELWPMAEIVDTMGPSGGIEPLVVFRKPR